MKVDDYQRNGSKFRLIGQEHFSLLFIEFSEPGASRRQSIHRTAYEAESQVIPPREVRCAL